MKRRNIAPLVGNCINEDKLRILSRKTRRNSFWRRWSSICAERVLRGYYCYYSYLNYIFRLKTTYIVLSIVWNKIKRKGSFIVVLRNRFFQLLYNFVILRRWVKVFFTIFIRNSKVIDLKSPVYDLVLISFKVSGCLFSLHRRYIVSKLQVSGF